MRRIPTTFADHHIGGEDGRSGRPQSFRRTPALTFPYSWACSCLWSPTSLGAQSKSPPFPSRSFQHFRQYAPQRASKSVTTNIKQSGLVFNSICASIILGEAFTRWSLAGTILVCGGAVLIAIFGAIAEPAHNLDQLLELLGRRQFVIWMIGQAILVIAIIVGARALKFLNAHDSNSPRMRLFRGMAYGCISGILSAHSLLVAKSAVELLVRTVADRVNQFNRWQSWASLLGLLVLALTQLYYLHKGLKLCSTSILYPFVFCVYNIIAILDGLIYFHQTSRLSVLHALLVSRETLLLHVNIHRLTFSRSLLAPSFFLPGSSPSPGALTTTQQHTTPWHRRPLLLAWVSWTIVQTSQCHQ